MRKLAAKKLGLPQVTIRDEAGRAKTGEGAMAKSLPHLRSRMPADSHREECRCGIVMKFSWTDEGFANKFIAIWWKRHSGEGHGKVSK